MLSVPQQILFGWLVMAVVMLLGWIEQKRQRNAGIVDVLWAMGTGGFGVFYAIASDGDPWRRLIVGLLAGIWGARLAIYLFVDRYLGKPEDGRYSMLREQWGNNADRWLLGFFQLQASWTVLFSLPFLVAAHNQAPANLWLIPGIAIWLCSIGGEVIADFQLARWRANPANRGRTCRRGLWKYSRHPNYFFEWLHWWSYVFLAIGSPYWWVTIAGTCVMYVFLLKITGIPYTEKRALLTREDYREYQQTTSAFIPWFNKKKETA